MKPNPAVWFEIYVQNLDRARKFYESVFQGKLEKLNSPGMDMWAFPMEMNASGAGGAWVRVRGVPAGANSPLFFLGGGVCWGEEGRATKPGGPTQKKNFPMGQSGFISLATAPRGNLFGLLPIK